MSNHMKLSFTVDFSRLTPEQKKELEKRLEAFIERVDAKNIKAK